MASPNGERDSLSIASLTQKFESGELKPADLLADVLARADRYPDPAVWIERCSKDDVFDQLEKATKRKSDGIPQPLYGIPFAIKDNIDLAGHHTTAACPAFAYKPAQSAHVVQLLCDAGAIAIGKTNLDQFATGLVGTRSPYGACRNVFDQRFYIGRVKFRLCRCGRGRISQLRAGNRHSRLRSRAGRF